jgi:hypothetical protein
LIQFHLVFRLPIKLGRLKEMPCEAVSETNYTNSPPCAGQMGVWESDTASYQPGVFVDRRPAVWYKRPRLGYWGQQPEQP